MFIASGFLTAAAIANATLFFVEFGLVDQLRSYGDYWATGLEEIWRWYPPFPNARRQVLADTKLGGQTVKAGTQIAAWLTAANRDPAAFRTPTASTLAVLRTHICPSGTAAGTAWAPPWPGWSRRPPLRSSWSDFLDFAATQISRWTVPSASSMR
jgi:hypothetical protein